MIEYSSKLPRPLIIVTPRREYRFIPSFAGSRCPRCRFYFRIYHPTDRPFRFSPVCSRHVPRPWLFTGKYATILGSFMRADEIITSTRHKLSVHWRRFALILSGVPSHCGRRPCLFLYVEIRFSYVERPDANSELFCRIPIVKRATVEH